MLQTKKSLGRKRLRARLLLMAYRNVCFCLFLDATGIRGEAV